MSTATKIAILALLAIPGCTLVNEGYKSTPWPKSAVGQDAGALTRLDNGTLSRLDNGTLARLDNGNLIRPDRGVAPGSDRGIVPNSDAGTVLLKFDAAPRWSFDNGTKPPIYCPPGKPGIRCHDRDVCTTNDRCDAAGKCVGKIIYRHYPNKAEAPFGQCNPNGATTARDGQVAALGVTKFPWGSLGGGLVGDECVTLDFGQPQVIARMVIRAFASHTPCKLTGPCAQSSCKGHSALVGAWSLDKKRWISPFRQAVPVERKMQEFKISLPKTVLARYLVVCREKSAALPLDVAFDSIRVWPLLSKFVCRGQPN